MGSRTAPRPPVWLLVLALVAATFPALVGLAAPAAAQETAAPTISGSRTRGEAPDYASERFADAWDYEQPTDIQTDNGPVLGIDEVSVSDGLLHLEMTSTGHFHPVWPGFPGGLRLGRDGPVNPIDATRYTHLSMRIRSEVQTYGSATWQTCPDITAGCEGEIGVFIDAVGWQTVTVDLREGTGEPWAGSLQALRLAIGVTGPTSFEIDWMRLHGQDTPTRITYPAPSSGPAELLWDADADPTNNLPGNPGWGILPQPEGARPGSATFDVAAHPPGTYRFALRTDAGTSSWSAPLTIEAAPRIRLLNPDITGGEDFATTVLGNPWDFSGHDDLAELGNVDDVDFIDGWLHGTNGGDVPGDPYLILSGLGDLQADRYHRFTVTMSYEGDFSLGFEPGGGAHGRVSWRQDGHHLWQQTAEVVTYTDINTYTVVLGVDEPSSIMEDDEGAQPGWNTGATTHELRWDVNEDSGAKRWRIDEIRLTADDESFGSFDLEWVDEVHEPGTSISLFADTDDHGFDGRLIASGLTTEAGVNTFTWDTTALPQGTYYIHAEASSPSGLATSRTYSTGPVAVRAPLASWAGAEPDGLRIAGTDRVTTAVALSADAFPHSSHSAIIARADDFPDALAASPLSAAIDAPVLLNPRSSLSPDVRAELERLGVERVIILGGASALAPSVEEELRSFVGIVERIAGADRFETAGTIAERAALEWTIRGEAVGAPLLALGSRFEDALSAASLAGHGHRPLLLTTANGLPAATAASLADLGATTATIVGGAGLVTDALEAAVRTQLGDVDRLAGADHVETAALVAQAAVAEGARGDIVLVASGDAFPDALAAGPAAIARGGILLLTPRDTLGEATAGYLSAGLISTVRIAGGQAAVSEAVGAALAQTTAAA